MPAQTRPKPLLLLILDGWGHRDDPADNALAQARLPNWRRLLAECPHTLVHTEGRHVGLRMARQQRPQGLHRVRGGHVGGVQHGQQPTQRVAAGRTPDRTLC